MIRAERDRALLTIERLLSHIKKNTGKEETRALFTNAEGYAMINALRDLKRLVLNRNSEAPNHLNQPPEPEPDDHDR